MTSRFYKGKPDKTITNQATAKKGVVARFVMAKNVKICKYTIENVILADCILFLKMEHIAL